MRRRLCREICFYSFVCVTNLVNLAKSSPGGGREAVPSLGCNYQSPDLSLVSVGRIFCVIGSARYKSVQMGKLKIMLTCSTPAGGNTIINDTNGIMRVCLAK